MNEKEKACKVIVAGLVGSGYEVVEGERDVYCVKPGCSVVQFVGCRLSRGGNIRCAGEVLVIMQGCKKLMEYK